MGLDLSTEAEAQELNLHLRESVENVSLVLLIGPSTLQALMVAVNATQLSSVVC